MQIAISPRIGYNTIIATDKGASVVQFREQGKKIQCILSTYDPSSKRSHQKLVASFDRWADSLPSDGLEELTDAERQELEAWFAARRADMQARSRRWKLDDAPRILADLADAVRAADTLTADHAARIWAGLGELAKALRKAGHPKPKRERPAPVALPGQADLLAEAAEPAPAVLPPASTGV
jgi:hypothetical protein